VVDYGCGPGSYISSLARMAGKSGKIFAVDNQPLLKKGKRTYTFQKVRL